ncbi:MAG: putative membrane protein [Nonlabens sp.]|jgi:predicted membrane protein
MIIMFYKNILTYLFFILCFYVVEAQIGIETNTPEAALDIASTDSGVLLPRIDVLSTTDATSVINPNGGALAEGTMVWNTAVTGIQPAGYYFWQGGTWNQVLSSNQKTVHFGKMIIDASGTMIVTGVGFQPTSIEFTAINRVQDYNDGAYRSGDNNSNDVRMASGEMTGYATNYGGISSQQVISFGTNGSSINNIGTYSSQNHCIAAYFVNSNADPIHNNGDNNGSDNQEGLIRASLTAFDTDGFTLNVDRFLAGANSNSRTNQIVVMFKAYR